MPPIIEVQKTFKVAVDNGNRVIEINIGMHDVDGGPAGFYALRESIKNGFADGGLVLDAPKVLNPNQNKDLTNYLSQAQSNSSQSRPIENNVRVIMVKDENEAKDWLYSPEGERAFLYHMKRNRSKV